METHTNIQTDRHTNSHKYTDRKQKLFIQTHTTIQTHGHTNSHKYTDGHTNSHNYTDGRTHKLTQIHRRTHKLSQIHRRTHKLSSVVRRRILRNSAAFSQNTRRRRRTPAWRVPSYSKFLCPVQDLRYYIYSSNRNSGN